MNSDYINKNYLDSPILTLVIISRINNIIVTESERSV